MHGHCRDETAVPFVERREFLVDDLRREIVRAHCMLVAGRALESLLESGESAEAMWLGSFPSWRRHCICCRRAWIGPVLRHLVVRRRCGCVHIVTKAVPVVDAMRGFLASLWMEESVDVRGWHRRVEARHRT